MRFSIDREGSPSHFSHDGLRARSPRKLPIVTARLFVGGDGGRRDEGGGSRGVLFLNDCGGGGGGCRVLSADANEQHRRMNAGSGGDKGIG